MSEKTEQLKLERLVLSAMIYGLAGRSAEYKFWTQLTEEDFTTAETRAIYRAVVKAREKGKVDLVNVFHNLSPDYQEVFINESQYENEVHASNDVLQAIDSIRQYRMRREINRYANMLLNTENKSLAEVNKIWNRVLEQVVDAHNIENERYYIGVDGKKALLETIEQIKDYKEKGLWRERRITGTSLDRKIQNFNIGDLNVLAARTSHGKTAMAVQIAENYINRDVPVLFVSIEMTRTQLMNRLLAHELKIPNYKLISGMLRKDEIETLEKHREGWNKPLTIYEKPGASLLDIINEVQNFKRQYADGQLVIVDYLQIVKPPIRREKRYVEVGDIAAGLGSIAKRYDVSVLALAQLNRGATRYKEPPRIEHLRESGDIEQATDKILLLWRPAKEHIEKVEVAGHIFEGEIVKNLVSLELAKNRHGQCGIAFAEFDGDTMRFRDLKSENEGNNEGNGNSEEEVDLPF